jgi:hypothetical protein
MTRSDSAGDGAAWKKKEERRQFKVGDRIRVSLPPGRIVDATIRAVIPSTEGIKLQIDWGHDQTALVHERDVLSE